MAARRGVRVVGVARTRDWLQVIAVDAGGAVFMTSWRPETGWSGWNPLAGAMTGFGGVVDAVSLRSGRVDVAMTGLDGRVQVLTDDAANGAALRHWQSLNGPVAASGIGLSIVATGGGGVAVLLTDTGGQNWIVDRRGSNDWGSWQPVGQ